MSQISTQRKKRLQGAFFKDGELVLCLKALIRIAEGISLKAHCIAKCDSANVPGGRCSSCISFGTDCTHDLPTKKRGPKGGYATSLGGRVQTIHFGRDSTEETITDIFSKSQFDVNVL
uniref:Zn(2)-C6 fungal-type domain-containing protein n=1 Tax=Moniliophthora roreri TaxID=221103 RepID=A0A0W0FEC8_MONRR